MESNKAAGPEQGGDLGWSGVGGNEVENFDEGGEIGSGGGALSVGSSVESIGLESVRVVGERAMGGASFEFGEGLEKEFGSEGGFGENVVGRTGVVVVAVERDAVRVEVGAKLFDLWGHLSKGKGRLNTGVSGAEVVTVG
jgi:hypothetical protein